MSSRPGHTYQATTPPPGAACSTKGCAGTAAVRLIVPGYRFEADGADHGDDPGVWEACDWHWPPLRDSCLRHGHQVVDITGDLGGLAAGFPHWRIFSSDGGRLYASAQLNGSPQGTTLSAWLIGPLRAQMSAAQVAAR